MMMMRKRRRIKSGVEKCFFKVFGFWVKNLERSFLFGFNGFWYYFIRINFALKPYGYYYFFIFLLFSTPVIKRSWSWWTNGERNTRNIVVCHSSTTLQELKWTRHLRRAAVSCDRRRWVCNLLQSRRLNYSINPLSDSWSGRSMPAGLICGSRVRYADYGRCLTCATPGYYSQCRSDTILPRL